MSKENVFYVYSSADYSMTLLVYSTIHQWMELSFKRQANRCLQYVAGTTTLQSLLAFAYETH